MSIDYEKFIRSNYNTLMNNVSSSVDSMLFSKINVNNPDILERVQIQDGKYSHASYVGPRYEGSKSTSLRYTFYTPGDSSYGKNAAIDFNTTKFAWVNNINNINLNFFDKSTINIKYLIDATGSLTQLSSKNNNIFEVQNMFKSGTPVVISLMDKYNPTNQSSLEGEKIIYEGGYRYSPILYREANENLNFLYDNPTDTIETKLGIKSVNVSSLLFQTAGNTDTDFTSSLSPTTIFKKNGVVQTNTLFSYNKFSAGAWPYTSQIPIFLIGNYRTGLGATFQYNILQFIIGGNPINFYYTLDWFTPDDTSTGVGGYSTNDLAGSIYVNTVGGERYTYFKAPRTSKYKVNVKVPFKISYGANPDSGPSIFKIVGVLEKQSVGSNSWVYLTSTAMKAVKIPSTNNIAVDIPNSSIYIDRTPPVTDPFIQVSCNIEDYDLGDIQENEKVRFKLYFVDQERFFFKTENIYFEIQSGDSSTGFFEVIDTANSLVVPVTSGVIRGTTDVYSMFSIGGTDNRTITFDITSSMLYNKSTFQPPDPDNPGAITNFYSPVEYNFKFEIGDIIKFGSYYSINPDLYRIVDIVDPDILESGNPPQKILRVPLQIKLDKIVNPSKATSRSFSVIRRVEDETSVIVNFKKSPGQTSNGVLVPYNLDKNVDKNISNIIAPLKEGILSKVLSVG